MPTRQQQRQADYAWALRVLQWAALANLLILLTVLVAR